MSFKIGDVCVYQNVLNFPHMDGVECVITKPLRKRRGPTSGELRMCFGTRNAVHGDGWTALVEPHQLRLKRPKDDAEPRTDFTPCDDDFREWLKARQRERA